MEDSDRRTLFDKAAAVLRRELPDLWAAYAYGSIATGEDSVTSDLDLAVLLQPGRRISNRLELLARLADAVGRTVDLVDLRNSGTILHKEVLAHGVPIYVAAPDRVLDWEGMAMTEYADHQSRIRDLLEDFERTGIAYAGR